MTSGERMVWAVAFDHARAGGINAPDAAFIAMMRVRDLQAAAAGVPDDSPERAMLDDMLSNGADR